jgi:hypothetical protein
MRILTFARRRPFHCAAIVFLLSVALIPVAVGLYLAASPNVGGWSGGWQGIPGAVPGRGGSGAISANDRKVIQTDAGPRMHDPSFSPTGSLLGTVDWLLSYRNLSGWPRPTRTVWTLSVTSIRPAPAGPLAENQPAWNGLVAEALTHYSWPPFSHPPLPEARRFRESPTVTSEDYWAFILNARDRLWHAPRWLAGSLSAAAAIGLAPGIALWAFRRRVRPGHCTSCGYDCTGIAGVCPECGAAIAA